MANIIQAGIADVGAIMQGLEAHLIPAAQVGGYRHERYSLIKIKGIALAVIAGLAALCAAMQGMFFTTLLAVGVAVIAADVARIGVNGMELTSSRQTQLVMIGAAVLRRPELWLRPPAEMVSRVIDSVLTEGTLVIHHLIKPSEWI